MCGCVCVCVCGGGGGGGGITHSKGKGKGGITHSKGGKVERRTDKNIIRDPLMTQFRIVRKIHMN